LQANRLLRVVVRPHSLAGKLLQKIWALPRGTRAPSFYYVGRDRLI